MEKNSIEKKNDFIYNISNRHKISKITYRTLTDSKTSSKLLFKQKNLIILSTDVTYDQNINQMPKDFTFQSISKLPKPANDPSQRMKKVDENSKILSSILTQMQNTQKSLEKPSKLKESILKFVEEKPIIEKKFDFPSRPKTLKPLENPFKLKENIRNVNDRKKIPFSEINSIHPPNQKRKKDDQSSNLLTSILTQKTPKQIEKPSNFKEPTIKHVKERPNRIFSNKYDSHINFEAFVEENPCNLIGINDMLNRDLSQQNQYRIPQDPLERVNWVFELFHSKAELVNYALKAPPRKSSSMEKVAQYISNYTKDKLEKYMIIFLWVTFNIEYDTESYFSEKISSDSCNSNSVFKNGKSVCAGYSSIFSDFCLRMGLNCIEISGYAKGYKYIKNQTFKKSNHAWNAIELDGKCFLIDSTWGAGAIDVKKQFVREFNPYYFMCPPQFFIEDHLPENDSFQFLQNKISKKQYEENYLYKLSHYFHGLYNNWNNRHVLISPTFILMHLDGERCKNNIFTLRFKLPGKKILTSLTSNNDQAPNETIEEATFNKEVERNEFEVKFIVPHSGNFELKIFGGDFSSMTYNFEFAYRIFCNNFKLDKKRFPKTYSFKAVYDLIEPLERDLPLSSNTNFKLKLCGYNKVVVIQNSDFSHLILNSSTGVWEGNVMIKCNSVSLSAQKEENESYSTICKYNGV